MHHVSRWNALLNLIEPSAACTRPGCWISHSARPIGWDGGHSSIQARSSHPNWEKKKGATQKYSKLLLLQTEQYPFCPYSTPPPPPSDHSLLIYLTLLSHLCPDEGDMCQSVAWVTDPNDPTHTQSELVCSQVWLLLWCQSRSQDKHQADLKLNTLALGAGMLDVLLNSLHCRRYSGLNVQIQRCCFVLHWREFTPCKKSQIIIGYCIFFYF